MNRTKKFKLNSMTFFTGLGLLMSCAGLAQNMVTNSTFEAKGIHNSYGEITRAHAWTNANWGTVDLFDKTNAGKNALNGIPWNYMGHQPSSDGQNYAGIIAYYEDGAYCDTSAAACEKNFADCTFGIGQGYRRYTEYLLGELREPMVAGTAYKISFRVNLADKSGRAVSCLGALLTSRKVVESNNTFLTLTPQFISHQVIADSVNWIVLSGVFTAIGGEKYVTIGCFKDQDFCVQKVVDKWQNDSRKAYYYISEISVTPASAVEKNVQTVEVGKQ